MAAEEYNWSPEEIDALTKALTPGYQPPKFETAEQALEAVKIDGWALEYVPEHFKTLELCIEALEQSGNVVFGYVPEALKEAVKNGVSYDMDFSSIIHDIDWGFDKIGNLFKKLADVIVPHCLFVPVGWEPNIEAKGLEDNQELKNFLNDIDQEIAKLHCDLEQFITLAQLNKIPENEYKIILGDIDVASKNTTSSIQIINRHLDQFPWLNDSNLLDHKFLIQLAYVKTAVLAISYFKTVKDTPPDFLVTEERINFFNEWV
jgi:hypothetical protein